MTMQGIATEAEMMDAVERWATLRGFGCSDSPAREGRPWEVSVIGGVVHVWMHDAPIGTAPTWAVTVAVALAWAILVESEPPPVDVGPCPECDGCGRQWWSSDNPHADWPDNKVYSWKAWPRAQWMGKRPCPACSGSGRHLVPVPRLFLDAPTDDNARALLSVLADKMQADGDLRGSMLSLALGPWSTALDLTGTGEAVEWLESMTDAREVVESNSKRIAVQSSRGTGRTARMLEDAAAAHARGERVLIVGHTEQYARELASRVGPGVPYVSAEWAERRLRGTALRPFVDHHARDMCRWSPGFLEMVDHVERERAITEAER